MKVLFATAELAPLTRVGGLGEACAGLVRELRARGLEVDVALPDYEGLALSSESTRELEVPSWAAPARARSGESEGFGRVTLIEAPRLARPLPYTDPASGAVWPDNAERFFGFSAAVAALARATRPDVLHLNDWHSAPVLGLLASPPPSVLTVHNLAYQGATDRSWLRRLPRASEAFAVSGKCNPLAGGIALADRVVTVSPTYAREILQPAEGAGLHGLLRERGPVLSGILNGVNDTSWNPSKDAYLDATYDVDHLEGKARCRTALLEELRWGESNGPLLTMVTRLTEQKGIDFALEAVPALANIGARLVVLGSGERAIAERARTFASAHPGVLRFIEDFDERLAHRILAGADLLLMPSRFEPCGLTQMHAMAYGTIPVVTPVGGLLDTVFDADRTPEGNGFVATAVGSKSFLAAIKRAVQGWRDPVRRWTLQERGMRRDWSWRIPADRYAALYAQLVPID